MKRNATAVWNGSGKEGNGHLTTQSTTLNKTQYNFSSRFAEGVGTNPEELVAAAHAGCMAMKLSFVLGTAGFTPTEIDINCEITLDLSIGAIVLSHLNIKATVPNISQEQFDAAIQEATKDCLISKLYNTTITHQATLVQ